MATRPISSRKCMQVQLLSTNCQWTPSKLDAHTDLRMPPLSSKKRLEYHTNSPEHKALHPHLLNIAADVTAEHCVLLFKC
eukprot:1137820-Pelagomonas_calceolata.AAC.1